MPSAVRKCNPSDKSKPQIWTAVICPFSQRVNFAFHLMGIDTEKIEVNLMDKPASLYEVNPNGQVPTIKDRGNSIYESTVCLQYIDEEWKSSTGVQLLPDDAAGRAKIRIFFEQFNYTLIPGLEILKPGKTREELDKATALMLAGYKAFNTLLETKSEGPFYGGKDPNAADVSMVPYGTRVDIFNYYFGFQIPKEWTRYHQWWEAMKVHPSYTATAPEINFLTKAAERNLGKYKNL